MESSRRSAMDRSREPGLKRPRLVEDDRGVSTSRDRPFPPPRTGNQPLGPRLRAGGERERVEREDMLRGESYQQQQELVAQYKTALAELTFNSKPIITNLTIIAGENLHAAKEIAATICANVLEVPSEQKLPSLYLLDSIVKNIGREYIKYFAARLPEVFCRAYKHVDSSVHPSMRHLFGTWKGVFPSATLQIIENELGFSAIVNGSSGAASSRPDSQTQRPPYSIHVNPKYLEARQRLQQSTSAKEIINDDISGAVGSIDAERSDKAAIIGSTRQWKNVPNRMPNMRPQSELISNPIHERKEFRDHEFCSDIMGQSDLGVGRVSERLKERDVLDKPYHGSRINASEMCISRSNGFDVNHAYGIYRASGSARVDSQLPSVHLNNTGRSIQLGSKNWKNSEEEEYMWDDMNSGEIDSESTDSLIKGRWSTNDANKPASLQKVKWMPRESKHLGSYLNKIDSLSQLRKTFGREGRVPPLKEPEELLQPHAKHDAESRVGVGTSADALHMGQDALEHPTSFWASHEVSPSMIGLNHASSRISSQSEGQSISFSGGLSTSMGSSLVSGSSGMLGQQRQQLLQPPSPSAHSPPSSAVLQRQKSQSSIDRDLLRSNSFFPMGQKPTCVPDQLSQVLQASVTQDSFPILAQNHTQHSNTPLNSHPPPSHPSRHLQNSSAAASAPLGQLRHHLPFLQQSEPSLSVQETQTQSQTSHQTKKSPPLPQSLGSHQTQLSGTNNSNNPAVEISGQPSTTNLLAAIMNSGLVPNNTMSNFQNLNIQPPLPSGPPPSLVATSSVPSVAPSSISLPLSHGDISTLVPPSTRPVLPPLPPGPPPPSSLVRTTKETSNVAGLTTNPLSSLLSSLVEKGLISSPATELPAATSVQLPNELANQSSGFANSSSKWELSTLDGSIIPSVATKGPSATESDAPTSSALVQSTTRLNDLLGIEFKPEIIRKFHPEVISSLFDELEHQCNICGLRFRLKEQFHGHLDWHGSKKFELSCFNRVSRKWYVNMSSWLSGCVGPQAGPVESTISLDEIVPMNEQCEPAVPADESQSICALCGEPFEDVYSAERDEWMYKGTVYLNLPNEQSDMEKMDESAGQVHIVHASCISRSSADNMEAAKD
ncbi:polyadenylation and cleavage factor [Cocos nucifera]|nr:polyadenylation and cleavage factor [Cocos nucifera]